MGFEPMISALRGQRPSPLDDGGKTRFYVFGNYTLRTKYWQGDIFEIKFILKIDLDC